MECNEPGGAREKDRQWIFRCELAVGAKLDIGSRPGAFGLCAAQLARAKNEIADRSCIGGRDEKREMTMLIDRANDKPFRRRNMKQIVEQAFGKFLQIITAAEIGAAAADGSECFGAKAKFANHFTKNLLHFGELR